ncbi:MAG: CPBP family intramembrane metalloprotease [Anaerolineae bacterium]|nr:CPBP family intramembrane metalloprotease [Anaerolineae bacterium]
MALPPTSAPLETTPAVGLVGWIQRHPLIAFFVLAFALTWPLMILEALRSQGRFAFPSIVFLLLMAYGPTYAALIVTGVTSGKAGIGALLRRLLVWRVGPGWYAVAILGLPALFLIANQVSLGLGNPPLAWPPLPIGPVLSVVVLFVVSSLVNGEELGWRGYALPRLLARHSALTASLMLGTVWALFHLPLFWTVGSTQSSEPPLGFLARTLAMSVIVTWLFTNTRGSVLLSILLHAAANTWSQVIPGIDTAHYPAGSVYWLSIGLLCLTAVVVVAVAGPARLSRALPSETGV